MLTEIHHNPAYGLIKRETEHSISCFCTFVSLYKGKKLSMQNILLVILQEPRIRQILKMSLSIDSDQEALLAFIEHDPAILKSKYVTKYVNSVKGTGAIVK